MLTHKLVTFFTWTIFCSPKKKKKKRFDQHTWRGGLVVGQQIMAFRKIAVPRTKNKYKKRATKQHPQKKKTIQIHFTCLKTRQHYSTHKVNQIQHSLQNLNGFQIHHKHICFIFVCLFFSIFSFFVSNCCFVLFFFFMPQKNVCII